MATPVSPSSSPTISGAGTSHLYKNADGGIDAQKSFLNLCGSIPPINFRAEIDNWRKTIISATGAHPNALNNVTGTWYEWLIALSAWNFYASNPTDNYIAIKLPNANSTNLFTLYKPDIYQYITTLSAQLSASRPPVSLITSNPDFIIIDLNKLIAEDPTNTAFNQFKTSMSFSSSTLSTLENSYSHLIGKCGFDSIIGFLGAKLSLRADRRLQPSHEGSLMKALHLHVQTRLWQLNISRIKYFACAIDIGPADFDGLMTVATHSLNIVTTAPERAVDEAFKVNSPAEADSMFRTILH